MEKKVLIIGPYFHGYNQSVEKAFKKLGWETKVVDFYESYHPITYKNRFLYGLLPLIGVKHFATKYDNYINSVMLKEYNEFKPGLVFVIKGHKVMESTLMAMKKSKTILWMMDSIFNRYGKKFYTYKSILNYDFRFMFEYTDVVNFEKEGVKAYFMPMAYDETIYYPEKNAVKDIDLFMTGLIYPVREKIMLRLIKEFKDIKMKFYGHYLVWRYPLRYIRYYLLGYRKYFMDRNIEPSEINKLNSGSKITLNIHHNQSNFGCNPRVYETLGSGAFHIVDENDYIKDNFSDAVVTFKNYEDLAKKLRYYLNNPNEREIIAEIGHNKVFNNHKYTDRIKEILDIAGIET
ncbi:CgeB family protein [Pseudobacteroides cellulosolvens]|uniref:Spore protein YkvP/CgeB glycosyl transferase-like domain-containing protein n=2 Tax=Pseudobacteroides cellulosolvens TaxID=35825 RepID=A0A0L6JV86_9FIRM|nr:glycosyltransferase [Pseudobacteroides cellulosolvens]KNY29644.1 hypothetical protein Bccel_4918 [Pseudobacteroides cellulosolvens ATCC 35603 = DSM 2933]